MTWLSKVRLVYLQRKKYLFIICKVRKHSLSDTRIFGLLFVEQKEKVI